MSRMSQPLNIRGMTLKNRVIMLPMVLGMKLEGSQARAFYAERAKGGAAAITTAATDLDLVLSDHARDQHHDPSAFLDGLRSLAEHVHAAGPEGVGVKVGVQLMQRNCYYDRIARPKAADGQAVVEWIAPSPRTEPDPRMHPAAPGTQMRAMTVAEIQQVITNFAEASARIREAGFDFVEVHSCHGGLPGQFFSPHDNQRDDDYGGDLLRRMRFGIECVTKIRAAVGNSFPIFFRLPAVDFCEPGITIEESAQYAAALEKAGVDCFSVSVGINDKERYFEHISPPRKKPSGTFAPYAAAIKRAVNVSVIAAGRINKPETVEAILDGGQADLAGLGRQLIADPMWPAKVLEGRAADIMACDSCNRYCWRNSTNAGNKVPPGYPVCRFNDRAGREWELVT